MKIFSSEPVQFLRDRIMRSFRHADTEDAEYEEGWNSSEDVDEDMNKRLS